MLLSDNQQGTPTIVGDSSETTSKAPFHCIKAYLQGAIHDGTLHKTTVRISQKNPDWLKNLQKLFKVLGYNSWIYQEGKKRNVYVLETVKRFLDFSFIPADTQCTNCKIFYARGFFDAEGGVPHKIDKFFYIQLSQKNREKIEVIKRILQEFGIKAGKVHNPSFAVDPSYWRIFVSRESLQKFITLIGSWHPVKQKIFMERTKIWSMPSGDRRVT